MPIGPHPDVRVRAAIVSDFSTFLVNLVIVGGKTIARFLGREWGERYQRTVTGLVELVSKVDISPEALQKGRE
jgi:hypothetical protein